MSLAINCQRSRHSTLVDEIRSWYLVFEAVVCIFNIFPRNGSTRYNTGSNHITGWPNETPRGGKGTERYCQVFCAFYACLPQYWKHFFWFWNNWQSTCKNFINPVRICRGAAVSVVHKYKKRVSKGKGGGGKRGMWTKRSKLNMKWTKHYQRDKYKYEWIMQSVIYEEMSVVLACNFPRKTCARHQFSPDIDLCFFVGENHQAPV